MRRFSCLITNAQPPQSVRNEMAFAFRQMEGKRVEITVAEHKERRSKKQNDSLWGVIYMQVREFHREGGQEMDLDEVHYEMKEMFGFKEAKRQLNGSYKAVPISTRKYTKSMMTEYWNRIAAHCAEFGHVLLMPNEAPF